MLRLARAVCARAPAGDPAWSKCRPGSAPARLLRLLSTRLVALGGAAPPVGEAEPLGAQPLPRMLERAASHDADPAAL